jgi:CRISPR/Cas system-associated endoribonuclease Cas2
MDGDNLSANDVLNNAEYREKLYSLFSFYGNELQKVIELATIECNGNRPKNVENEIYSAFHHIWRSMFKGDLKSAYKDIEDAQNSHLLRVQYDAYKVAINASLCRVDKIAQDYEFLLIDKDFREIMPKAVEVFQSIHDMHKDIRDKYLKAKEYERIGDRKEAVSHYEYTVNKIPDLREKIEEIESDTRFKVALLNVKKNAGAAKEQLDTTKKWTYISLIAAITSLIAAVAAVFNVWYK